MGFANAFVLALLVMKQILVLMTTLYVFVNISSVWLTNYNSKIYQPSVPWRKASKEREARKRWWIRSYILRKIGFPWAFRLLWLWFIQDLLNWVQNCDCSSNRHCWSPSFSVPSLSGFKVVFVECICCGSIKTTVIFLIL